MLDRLCRLLVLAGLNSRDKVLQQKATEWLNAQAAKFEHKPHLLVQRFFGDAKGRQWSEIEQTLWKNVPQVLKKDNYVEIFIRPDTSQTPKGQVWTAALVVQSPHHLRANKDQNEDTQSMKEELPNGSQGSATEEQAAAVIKAWWKNVKEAKAYPLTERDEILSARLGDIRELLRLKPVGSKHLILVQGSVPHAFIEIRNLGMLLEKMRKKLQRRLKAKKPDIVSLNHKMKQLMDMEKSLKSIDEQLDPRSKKCQLISDDGTVLSLLLQLLELHRQLDRYADDLSMDRNTRSNVDFDLLQKILHPQPRKSQATVKGMRTGKRPRLIDGEEADDETGDD
ncbi:hypothetical protein BT69DRAFT_727977 [Atractiella rhizophila]|nr:hypothetical protein BT69DRAFT_727977 [Atractiella rhizophila]